VIRKIYYFFSTYKYTIHTLYIVVFGLQFLKFVTVADCRKDGLDCRLEAIIYYIIVNMMKRDIRLASDVYLYIIYP